MTFVRNHIKKLSTTFLILLNLLFAFNNECKDRNAGVNEIISIATIQVCKKKKLVQRLRSPVCETFSSRIGLR